MEIKRRDFLKFLGGSIAGFGVGSIGEAIIKIPYSAKEILYSGPRLQSWKLTTCMKCPGGCSLKIRLIDGLPIQALGNPLSPVNEGGICPMGLTHVETLYHPARLTGPMKKVNGKFMPISYEEAFETLSNELKKLISEKKQQDLFFVAQTESKLRVALFEKFMDKLGSRNLVVDNFSYNSLSPYLKITDELPDFVDFDSCDFILNFGSQFTEISDAPLYFTRKINEFKSEGKKIVAFQSRLTPSVSKANEWIPINPALYGIMASGIAYVLLRDGLYDNDFTEKNFNGFESFKKKILEDFTPDKVAKLTNVPPQKIIEIGRRFGNSKTPVAFLDESILYSSNGTDNALSVIALNALKGFKGFGEFKEPVFPAVEKPHNRNTFYSFNDRLTNGKDISLLMIYNNNFVFNNPNQDVLKRKLQTIPFIVSFSSFIDETTKYANLIIPDHDDMERQDIIVHNINFQLFSIQQPIVKPFYQTVDTGDVLISLMRKLAPLPNVPYGDYEAYLKEMVKDVYKKGEGIIMSQAKPTHIEKGLKKIGWQVIPYANFDEFWGKLMEYGGWWNPYTKKNQYKPKLDFKSKSSQNPAFTMPKYNSASLGDKLYLNIFRKNLDYKGSMGIQPVLIEQFGINCDVYWDMWAEINPETAQRLSIPNRGKALIKTDKGRFSATIIYNSAVMPQNIDVPFGLGHTDFGDNSGANPLSFSNNVFDKATGKPSFSETLAEIEVI